MLKITERFDGKFAECFQPQFVAAQQIQRVRIDATRNDLVRNNS